MTNDQEREWYVDGARRTGYGVDPLPFFDDRARPHPVATLLHQPAVKLPSNLPAMVTR